jgi:membrane-bound lytic murein transglycosylase D
MNTIQRTLLLSGVTVAFLAVMGSVDRTDSNKEDEVVSNKASAFGQHYHIASPPIPKAPVFAGEVMPVQQPDVKERLERELLVNTYWQSNTSLLIKRAGAYFPIIEPILAEEGVPEDFKYLAMAESGLTQAKSPAGARGFWQFLTTTGKSYGLEIRNGLDERYHIEKSTRAACEYLKKAKEQFGTWTLAAAAYNRGENGLSRALSDQHVKSYYDLYLNPETARYVYRIVALKYIYSTQEDYGFHIGKEEYYTLPNTYLEKVDKTIEDLPKWAIERGTNYKVLRSLNPWIRSYELTVPASKVYYLKMPELELNAEDE